MIPIALFLSDTLIDFTLRLIHFMFLIAKSFVDLQPRPYKIRRICWQRIF